MSAPRRPRRYVFLAAGFLALAVAGTATGTAADAHHVHALSELAALLVGGALAVVIAMLGRAYAIGAREPSRARRLTAMLAAMDTGQAVSGTFQAGLRNLVPGVPLTRWKSGRVLITPQSVTWKCRMTRQVRDLTGAQCTSERRPDHTYTDLTLSLPGYYQGENVMVITLHASGTDVELAAPAQLLAIIRYSLARTSPAGD